jgi:hypothetical protein
MIRQPDTFWKLNRENKMPNMDYRLFLEEDVDFLCALREGNHGQWESVKARSPIRAAKIYYENLSIEFGDFKSIYVLRPGENPGVDKPLYFLIGNLKNIE